VVTRFQVLLKRTAMSVAATGVVVGAACIVTWKSYLGFDVSSAFENNVNSLAPDMPIQLPASRSTPTTPVSLNLPEFERDLVNPSCVLHALILNGLDSRISIAGRRAPVLALAILTDANLGAEVLGSPAVVRTRWGARFTIDSTPEAQRANESHRDQALALLAVAGAPLSLRLDGVGGSATLRDILLDSLANFELDQHELEWTTIAYALYLTPRSAWSNRFGATHRLDDLVVKLMQKARGSGSCAGTHKLQTLATVLSAHDASGVLSPQTAAVLTNYIESLVESIEATQEIGGAWPQAWCNEISSTPLLPATPNLGLIITGHLLEGLEALPASYRVSERTMLRAADYLQAILERMSDEEIIRNFCPFTHAIKAVAASR